MKHFIFALVIVLCLSLCSCMHSPDNQAEGTNSNPTEESTNPAGENNGLFVTDPEKEIQEITLPNHWGTLDLPEIELDDPTGGETVTTPPATESPTTEPPAETEGEESTAPSAPTEDEGSGIITTPEDVFE